MVKIHALALLFALLLSCVSGTTYLECSCSASNRGFRANVLTELKQSREALRKFAADLWGKHKRDGSPDVKTVGQEINLKAIDYWKACLSNWKHEECVNADTRLRLCNTKNCVADSFCKYQAWNWVNVRDGRALPGCNTSPILSSDNANIIAGKPEVKTQVRPSNSPTPSPSKKAAIPIPTKDPDVVAPNNTTANTNNNNNATKVGPTVTPAANNSSPTPIAVAGEISPVPSAVAPDSANEGCVAVEHLEGLVLQHREHLLRNVLCSHNFCATANHAIIVDGEWTSMKRLCMSSWNCVRTVKLVNNLKVTANRRAVVSDSIVITPYDMRFPRWGVWVAQGVEIAFNAVGLSGIAAGVFALAAVVYKPQKQYQ